MDSAGRRLGHTVGGYREYAAPVDLAALVSVLWTHRSHRDVDPTATTPHRVVPEPDVSICYVSRRGNGGVEPEGVFLIGPVRRARFYDPEPGIRMYAVRLKPEWCRALLGTHPGDHVDAVDDMEAIRPDLARPLLDALARQDASRDVLQQLAHSVRGWAAHADVVPDAELAHQGLERLRRAGPGMRIEDVCGEWGVSSRHLRRTVLDATGTSPKRLLRAKRLAAILFRAGALERPNWSRLAVAAGYYDQPHLIRECHTLAGAPPAVLHAERRAQPVPDES